MNFKPLESTSSAQNGSVPNARSGSDVINAATESTGAPIALS
jgi:hypothetical protein